MKFAPRPENDFADYIRTYYEACRYRCDKIEAIAGKWMFRDLLPGMSDFDTRAPIRALKTRPRSRSMVSGPTNGTAAGRFRTIAVKGMAPGDIQRPPISLAHFGA